MSVATIDYPTYDLAAQRHHDDVVEVAGWVGPTASLRRPFTAIGYRPRHRADGPAR